MLKIGLIGCGFMGSTHAACYEALSDYAKIVAVADVRKEKALEIAKTRQCEIFENGEELIKNAKVDVIDICLPTYLHTKHGVLAMEKGYDVFIEKPVCFNQEEATLLSKTQLKTGKQVMVGQVIRSWDEYKLLKTIIDENKYGNMISAVFKRLSPLPTWSYQNWILNPKLSGTMALDLHIHDVDFMRYAFGEPDDSSANVSRNQEGEICHIVSTHQYGDKMVSVEGCWNYPADFPFSMEYRIAFEHATMVFHSATQPPVIYLKDGGLEHPKLNTEFTKSSERGGNLSSLGGYYNELKYFVQRLDHKEPIEIATLEDSIKSLNLVLNVIEKAGGMVH